MYGVGVLGYGVWGMGGASHRSGYGYGRLAVVPEAPGMGYDQMLAGQTARGMGYTTLLYPLQGAKYDDGEVTEEDLVKETWHLSTEQEGGGREVGGGEDGKAMDVQEDDPGTFDSDDEHTAVPPVVVGGEDGEDGKSAGGPIILDAYPAVSVDSEDGDDGVDGDQACRGRNREQDASAG